MQRISLLVVVKAVLVALVELEVLEEAFVLEVLQYNKKQKYVLVVLAVLVVLLEECLEGSGDDQHLAEKQSFRLETQCNIISCCSNRA